MAITFHCDHCGKKIEAPDSAGGKWGKCPSCHNRLYIPNLNIVDDLKLAPINEEDEEKKQRLMAETYRLSQDILLEKEIPNNSAEQPSEINERDLTKNIIIYLRQMADGELEKAQAVAKLIVPQGKKAVTIIDKIALSEIPEPELADIPQQVLSGLIRKLRSQIK